MSNLTNQSKDIKSDNGLTNKEPLQINVKVGDYRNSYDAVNRAVNCDYHACVNAKELVFFKAILVRRLTKLQTSCCKRASAYDKEQAFKAVEGALACIAKVDDKLAQKAH